jgi:7-cyano-7-deazaguanine synthase
MSATGRNALVLFSGGQDSTTCLAWALEEFQHVETVGFAYGQRHSAEMAARPRIISRLAADFPRWGQGLGADHVLSLDVLAEIGGSALTDDVAIAMGEGGLPTTFVPGRNLLFLTAAAALGYRRGICDLVGGMCETDYSGYPDCRNETVQAMQGTLGLGLAHDIRIHTPLMFIDKSETWRMAERIGGRKLVDLVVEDTVTCYRGDRQHWHDWGYGCSDCPACRLRANGYARYRGVGVAP